MNQASFDEKLLNTDRKINFGSRVKTLLNRSPLLKLKRRSMSLSAVTQSQQGPAHSAMFGIPLDVLLTREGGDIPFIVRKIAGYIEQNGLDTEGIYRVNGNTKIIDNLKMSFDKVGDANFHRDLDIAAIAGLLKLFLRELPDGIIPLDMVSRFMDIQQSHPREATPEALSLLQQCIYSLPSINYYVLKYLIRHLFKVAQCSAQNKMSPVSLSIVFGPNIFHCGDGLAGLQLQGYSNSTVCRMIQYHDLLFQEPEKEVEVVLRKRPVPSKPRPYSEHILQMKSKQTGSPTRNTMIGESTSDLERTFSERSIDEAILDRSSESLSSTSPFHVQDTSSPVAALKSPPPRPPQPILITPSRQEPLLVKSSTEDFVGDSDDNLNENEESPFQRRNAKRGLKFSPRSTESDESFTASSTDHHIMNLSQNNPNKSSPASKNSSINGNVNTKAMTNGSPLKQVKLNTFSTPENDRLMQISSPHSGQSSPGESPVNSPTITPRSSRIISSVIDQSVKQFLFQSSVTPQKPTQRETSLTISETPKADVYGLLLPNKVQRSPMSTETTTAAPTTSSDHTGPNSMDNRNSPSQEASDSFLRGTKPEPTVKRRSSTGIRKLKNRKSSLYADFATEPSQQDPDKSSEASVLHMDVQIVSLNPEQSALGETNVETRQGKLSDLIQEFELKIDREAVQSGRTSKRKSSSKGSEGAPQPSQKGISTTSPSPLHTTESNSVSTHSQSANIQLSTKSNEFMLDSYIKPVSNFQLLATILQGKSTSGRHAATPVLLSSTQDTLSLNGSKSVSLALHRTGQGEDTIDGSQTSSFDEFNEIKREKILSHVTLSRPKGPAARRKPHRSLQIPSSSNNTRDIETPESFPVTNLEHTKASLSHSTLQKDRVDRLKTKPKDQTTTDSHTKSSSTSVATQLASHKETLPVTDFTSLAPEILQEPVRQGWKEDVGDEKSEEVLSLPVKTIHQLEMQGVKEHNQRIHDLKKKIWDFDVKFQSAHGHKPAGSEKAPIRNLIEEASALKKQLKVLDDSIHPIVVPPPEADLAGEKLRSKTHLKKLDVTGRDGVSISSKRGEDQTDHQPVSQVNKFPVISGKRRVESQISTICQTESKTIKESTTSTMTPNESMGSTKTAKESMASKTAAKESMGSTETAKESTASTEIAKESTSLLADSPEMAGDEGQKLLLKTLDTLITSLQTRRVSIGRPEQINDMNPTQLHQEKRDIQKVLLQFEKSHGRPTGRQEKETMKPLYDHYRLVKKLCANIEIKKKDSLSSPPMSTSALELTNDSLPSVTLLQSSTLAHSLPTVPNNKNVPPQHALSKSAHEMRIDGSVVIESTHNSPPDHSWEREVLDKSIDKEIMSDSQLKQATLEELTQQNVILLETKKKVRKILKDFENRFYAKYGRSVQREDKTSMQDQYEQYKCVKTKLRKVSSLIAAISPQETI